MKLQRTAVVGAGTMGGGIAQVLAAGGLQVLLYDADPAASRRALEAIAQRLRRRVEKGELDEAARRRILERLEVAGELSQLSGAEWIIEAVPERLELKTQVFAALDRHAAPGAVLASNTSGLDIARLAAATQRPEKVMGMHFFNPPPRMPLVELVRGERTAEEVFERGRRLVESLGKIPIAAANRPGFVVNRILFPMINEAIFTLEEGVAGAEEIDRALRLGAGHPLGPLALADFVGLDVTLDILESFVRGFGDQKYRPCPLLRRKVERGELGRKSGRGFFEYT